MCYPVQLGVDVVGLGDDLMAVGEAWHLHLETGGPVEIGRRPGKPHKSPVFENLSWLGPGGGFVCSHPGKRPCIDYKKSSRQRQVLYRHYRPKKGVLHFTTEERRLAGEAAHPEAVYLEPHVKGSFSGQNKAWPWEYWQVLVELLYAAGYWPVQISDPKQQRTLKGVERISEPLRLALATLSHASRLITTDGLMHHAAAAMGVPTVVIWGGRTSPSILGYEDQTNLYVPGEPCGMRVECEHCKRCMTLITPQKVMEAL